MSWKSRQRTLKRNKWRYISLTLGFFLLVAPFAFLFRAFNLLAGSQLPADIHSICYRVPLAWITGPGPLLVDLYAATILILFIIFIAFLFGPLFCGWLCPVGAVGEAVSRCTPIPDRSRLRIRETRVTSSLRYGFFVGFILLAVVIGQQAIAYQYGGVTCRYCASYLLETGSSLVFTGSIDIEQPMNAGLVLAILSWLVIGGIMMVGGRGWCLFFCPLGALSGLAHKIGSSVGLYRIDFKAEKCVKCKKCQTNCPVWAIGDDHSIERSLCIGCRECTKSCVGSAYNYKWGRGNVGKDKPKD
jgi:ferredoxin-type protein NapH